MIKQSWTLRMAAEQIAVADLESKDPIACIPIMGCVDPF